MSKAETSAPGWLPWLAAGVFLAVFFSFYPLIYAIRDESVYLKMAVSLSADLPEFFRGRLPFSDVLEHLQARFIYPFGIPLLLIPLLQMGWPHIFLLGLGFHLMGFYFFQKLAAELGEKSGLSGLLYLFFPAFVLYSRTVMSDIPVAAIYAAAYYFYFSRNPKKGWAGILFGLNLLLRGTNLIFAAAFGAVLIWRAVFKKEISSVLRFFAGFTPLFCLWLGVNFLVWGNPFETGYGKVASGVENFAWRFFNSNLIHYLKSLLTAYPLMLAVFLFFKPARKPEILLSLGAGLVFFSLYYFRDRFPSPLATLIFGNRFLFPVAPFLLLGYGCFLCRLRNFLPSFLRSAFVLLVLIALAAGSFVISREHQHFLAKQAALKNLLYSSTEPGSILIDTRFSTELVQSFWGPRTEVQYEGEEMAREVFRKAAPGQKVYWVHRLVAPKEGGPLKDVDSGGMARTFNLQPVVDSGELLIDQVISEK